MKKHFITIFSILLLLALSSTSCQQKADKKTPATAPSSMTVMSFNLRYDNQWDGDNDWSHRFDRVVDAISFYNPDLLGTQEGLNHMLTALGEKLPQYSWFGVGREDGVTQGEYSAIFYKKDRFKVVDEGYFWLSEKSNTPSKGWDAACERIATWAILEDLCTNSRFFFLDTHLDHEGKEARKNSVDLLLNCIEEKGGELPIIMTGDFNSTPDSDVVLGLTNEADPRHVKDSKALSPIHYGPAWSYHEFGNVPVDERPLIDYIFVKNIDTIKKYGVLADGDSTVYVSDHAPVLVELELP